MLKSTNLQNIINPPKDFMVIGDILKEKDKYLHLVYNKIFSEFASFLEKNKNLKIQSVGLKKDGESKTNMIGKISLTYAKRSFNLLLTFQEDIVSMFLNEVYLDESNIFGALIDKHKGIVSNIKIDLVSLKKKLMKTLKKS